MSASKEVTFEMWRLQERRCYFTMSSAGAGIGYALATVEAELTTMETRVFLLTILLWAISFLAGLKLLTVVSEAMRISRLNVIEGKRFSSSPDALTALREVMHESTEKLGETNKFVGTVQLISLIGGAISFVFLKIDVSKAVPELLLSFQ